MKRMLSTLLTAAILFMIVPSVVTVLPASAFSGSGWEFDVASGTLTVTSSAGTTNWRQRYDSPNFRSADVKTLIIGSNVRSIGQMAFASCVNLTSVVIPDSVTAIAMFAFSECYMLTDVKLSERLTSMDTGTFFGCVSLETIVIPDSVTNIGINTFTGCTSLTSIQVGVDNTAFSSVDGVLFNKAQTQIVKYPSGKNDAEFSIPDTVTTIRNSAFADSKLTSIVFPSTLASIEDYAFMRSTRLKELNIPKSVTNIGKCAFMNCVSLTSLTLPGSVKAIKDSTFLGCQSLASVTLSEGVTAIEANAFTNCDKLVAVIIPPSVTKIDRVAIGYTRLPTDRLLKNDDLHIFGAAGTDAERYAKQFDFKFVEYCFECRECEDCDHTRFCNKHICDECVPQKVCAAHVCVECERECNLHVCDECARYCTLHICVECQRVCDKHICEICARDCTDNDCAICNPVVKFPHRIGCDCVCGKSESQFIGKHGHVLGNEKIGTADALEILKHIVGLDGNLIGKCNNARKAATITGSATGVIGTADALEILKRIVGLPSLIDTSEA